MSIKAHWEYLKYVVRHKWYVFWACLDLGVPIWLALFHDMSKFSPAEWGPYVRQFFNPDGSKRKVRDSSGAYDPNAQPVEFQRARLHHQKNKHHWQAWVSLGDGGVRSVLPIPERYVKEMVADWYGAGAAQGKADPESWYLANSNNLVLHSETRWLIRILLMRLWFDGGAKDARTGR